MENNLFSTRKNYRFIPYDRFDFSLKMGKEEVLEKLFEGIETNSGLSEKNWLTGKFESIKLFEGRISDSGFEMTKLSATRNSFVPTIRAEIIEIDSHKTVIRGTQKLNAGILVLSVIFFYAIHNDFDNHIFHKRIEINFCVFYSAIGTYFYI